MPDGKLPGCVDAKLLIGGDGQEEECGGGSRILASTHFARTHTHTYAHTHTSAVQALRQKTRHGKSRLVPADAVKRFFAVTEFRVEGRRLVLYCNHR
jgi:hypothetical protein